MDGYGERQSKTLDIFYKPTAEKLGRLKDVLDAKMKEATAMQSDYAALRGKRYNYLVDSSLLPDGGFTDFAKRLTPAYLEKTYITVGGSYPIDADVFITRKRNLDTGTSTEECYFMVIEDETRNLLGVSKQTREIDPETNSPIKVLFSDDLEITADQDEDFREVAGVHMARYEFDSGILDYDETEELIVLLSSICAISQRND